MSITIVYASQAQNREELEKRYDKYCITKSVRSNEVYLQGLYNNSRSLPALYNSFIKDEDSIVILAHDDVYIRDFKWIEKLNTALEKYDVVGLAGASNAKITEPCLWHIMCSKEDHRGRVSHVSDGGKSTFVTNFGPHGRVLILDGLFLAFKNKKIFNSGARFDESNPAKFHFYDIDFCLTCNSKKLKLGTADIDVVHNSHGLRSFTDEWLSGQAWFKQKVADGKY